MTNNLTETIFKRDRIVVVSGLAGIVALAWVYMFYQARGMSNTDMGLGMEMAMPNVRVWGIGDFVLIFLMWTVMQIAMMTPTAAPMVLMFAKVNRQRHRQQSPLSVTGVFLLGYLIVWTGFSALAALAQWGLHTAALLSPMMVSTSPILGGVLLLAAGLFQFTPLKQACLTHCRSPLGFFITEWREGTQGALIMGLRHGGYCVVCCWLLMALLFVSGVMNLLWMAVITAFVVVEKVVPAGDRLGRIAGALFIIWAAWMIFW